MPANTNTTTEEAKLGKNFERFKFYVEYWMVAEFDLPGKALLLYAWLWKASNGGDYRVRVTDTYLKKLLCTNSNASVRNARKALEKNNLIAIQEEARGSAKKIWAHVNPNPRKFAAPESGAANSVSTAPESGAANSVSTAPESGAATAPLFDSTAPESGAATPCANWGNGTPNIITTEYKRKNISLTENVVGTTRENGSKQSEKQKKALKKVVVEPSTKYGFIAHCPHPMHQGKPGGFEPVVPGDDAAVCKVCHTQFSLDWSRSGVRKLKPDLDYSDHPETFTCSCGAECLPWDEARHGFECPSCNTFFHWDGKPM